MNPTVGSIVSGSAWVGTVCLSNNLNINGGTNNGKGFRTSISLWLSSDLQCAETVSHEIGHNLGMQHDFTDPNIGSDRFCGTDPSKNCVNTQGIMDYNQVARSTWSCCSNSDFLRYYQQNQPFCLAACDQTEGGCGLPQYQGDNFCDDVNNNAGCEYDGGDCCGLNVNITFCTECECLDPSNGNRNGNVSCGGHDAGSCEECPQGN